MTEQNSTPQVSAQQLLNLALNTSFGRAVVALVIGFIGLLLPFTAFSTNIGLGADQSGSLNGFEAAGWAAWLMVLLFILAAAAWKVLQLAPYRLVLSAAAAASALLAIVVGWFFNPAARQLSEIQSTLGALGANGNLINIGPHIGMLVVLIAAALVGWTGWKAR